MDASENSSHNMEINSHPSQTEILLVSKTIHSAHAH